jgi:phospholipid/cholesterol/gamma-HCH transport system ATP-binding protein
LAEKAEPRRAWWDRNNHRPRPKKIDNLIQEITHEYDITTIVVTHDMNSVLEIGEYVIFLHQGLKLWEGTNEEILNGNVPELNEFLFSNKLIRDMRK